MKEDPRCKSCLHFISWGRSGGMYYDSEPNGVCSAPRALIGPAPNREVKRTDGKNCPSWEERRRDPDAIAKIRADALREAADALHYPDDIKISAAIRDAILALIPEKTNEN